LEGWQLTEAVGPHELFLVVYRTIFAGIGNLLWRNKLLFIADNLLTRKMGLPLAAAEAHRTRPLRIVVIGGGLGGLCLAQALVAQGAAVTVDVYERDASPDVRGQGYRLTIDAVGAGALAACAPADVLAYLVATAKRPPPAGGTFVVLDGGGRRLFESLPFVPSSPSSVQAGSFLGQVDRAVLRRALLTGLEDRVHFGRAFVRYEAAADGSGVAVHFTDGSSAHADLLVGADGVRSRIRQQLLPAPALQPRQSGVRGVFGRTLLRDCPRLPLLSDVLASSGVLALGPGAAFFCTSMVFGESPAAAAARLGLDCGVVPPRLPEDYVMWGVAYRDRRSSDGGAGGGHSGGHSADAALSISAASFEHPDFSALVRHCQPDDCADFPVWHSPPPPPPSPPLTPSSPCVTLLGDAAHAMPPFGAHGANTALRDAAVLAARLQPLLSSLPATQPHRHRHVQQCVRGYEDEMRRYAGAASTQAQRMMTLATASAPAAQALTRMALRLAHGAVRLAGALRR
jgi:2-polyprenyl-6-methoxyphenol hydroxylase-like FAD-dependent oxidoreductase